jgi:hypothetical protein
MAQFALSRPIRLFRFWHGFDLRTATSFILAIIPTFPGQLSSHELFVPHKPLNLPLHLQDSSWYVESTASMHPSSRVSNSLTQNL